MLKDIQNIKISVIGAARSGIGAAQLLKSKGAIVFVSDSGRVEDLIASAEIFNRYGIDYEFGSHTEKVFDCSLMVISPGVPSNSNVVTEAQRRGIKVINELEIASWYCKTPIIAVTGSNGKTTTTALIGEIFKEAGRNFIVAGNIGTAFSGLVSSLDVNSTAILEVSSFQLDHIENFQPNVSIILNITPDHMDRYENSMEKYSSSKARIFMNQKDNDLLIYNIDDEIVKKIVQKAGCKKVPFSYNHSLEEGIFVSSQSDGEKIINIASEEKSTELINTLDLGIKGIHNVYNSMAAVLAAKYFGIDDDAIKSALKKFKGVEHRLEFVRELNGVKYINDSKATNVDSVWYALSAIDEPIILLLGGRDKGNDYLKLFKIVQEKVKAIIAIGESSEKVYNEFREYIEVKKVDSMFDAVQEATEISDSGDVILLSPACASFDWFDNYEHRGKVFKELVNKL